jgi:CRISPR-associated endonuclease Cas1
VEAVLDLHASDDMEWAIRSGLWASQRVAGLNRKRRERSPKALVLCGHGVSLRVEAGTLLIKNGFTHYPQKQETYRYFRGDLDRPSRIVLLDGSGSISFDVLNWLAEQEIPLIRISWTGDAVTVIGGNGYSADREKVEWQRATRANPRERLAFGSGLIREKIRNSISALDSAIPKSEIRDSAISKLRGELTALDTHPPEDIDALRGMEGRAGAAYFSAWRGVKLDWASNKRKPIPPAWHTIGSRTALRSGKIPKNRNATHPINAMLNYAYAVLLGQLKIQLVSEGYDPTIGVMHHDYRRGPAFVLDHMEPLRPVVDREVLGFALSNQLHTADFVLRHDGVCRLNPQLARHVVGLVGFRKAAPLFASIHPRVLEADYADRM